METSDWIRCWMSPVRMPSKKAISWAAARKTVSECSGVGHGAAGQLGTDSQAGQAGLTCTIIVRNRRERTP